jgi:hypothetical protein
MKLEEETANSKPRLKKFFLINTNLVGTIFAMDWA